MNYTRISQVERKQMERWRQEESKSIREIGRLLGRAASTISRELRRDEESGGYGAVQAQRQAERKAKRSGPRVWTEGMKEEVKEKLEEGWTPEIISQRARKQGRRFVCKESIYQSIYRDAKQGGRQWEKLPRAGRKRRRRCPRKEGRGRGVIPFRRDIDQRPAQVEKREEGGHWEGDLINGAPGSGHLVTLVERRSRFTLVGRVQAKQAGAVRGQIIRSLRRARPMLRTLTLDNGKEFAEHRRIEAGAGVTVYFAKPYHSWERGSNEQVNGLIRRMYPKGTSFAGIGPDQLRQIERNLNTRPRKCLGWKTPEEEMTILLAQAAPVAA
jgi:IS30 family transposase